MICIDFLNEQLSEFDNVSKTNSENARSGWEKRRKDATALQPHSDPNAIREEKRIEDEIKVYDTNTAADTATNKSEAFMQRLIPYVDTYGKDMMREFFNYWTEKNEGGKKMRFEMQKVFDVSRRLSTWSERAKNNKFNTNGKPTYKTVNEQINNL